MSTQSDIKALEGIVTGLENNPVAKFSYTDAALAGDIVDGVPAYDSGAEQNVPLAANTDFNATILNKGVRTQAASMPRNAINHFFGRVSYNLNKLVQKFHSFLTADLASRAHNANDYDDSATYLVGDVCYSVATDGVLYTKRYFRRIGAGSTIGVSVDNSTYWKQLMPKDIGNHREYTIADLRTGYDTGLFYPVVTTLQDFQAQIGVTKDPVLRVEIEAFCNGAVFGFTNPQRADFRVQAKFTGFAATSTDILFDNACVDMVSGVDNTASTPIRFTKLPIGRQAVIWLRGGTRYALWNSFGSPFTLYTSTYSNGLDADVAPVADVATVTVPAPLPVDATLLDGQDGSFYQNASNLNAGTLPAARFNDTAHGSRSGGALHAAATGSVNGFMPATDKAKLDAATSAGTGSTVMMRDGAGRAQVAAPSAAADIARKDTVDTAVTAHANLTSPHSATNAATPSRLIIRDGAGRAQVAAPLSPGDIARKDTVDAHADLTSAHYATSAANASRLIIRDSAGRAQVAAPSAAADIARKADVDTKLDSSAITSSWKTTLASALGVGWGGLFPLAPHKTVLTAGTIYRFGFLFTVIGHSAQQKDVYTLMATALSGHNAPFNDSYGAHGVFGSMEWGSLRAEICEIDFDSYVMYFRSNDEGVQKTIFPTTTTMTDFYFRIGCIGQGSMTLY